MGVIDARNTRLLIAAIALLWATFAWPHARFVSAEPAADSTLNTSPAQVTLSFNEPVQPIRVSIVDQGGASMAASGDPRSVDNNVLLDLATPLPPGRYVLSYRVLSSDAHPIAASFGFAIADATGQVPVSAANSNGSLAAATDWGLALIVSRAAYMLGLLLCVGGVLFILLLPAAKDMHAPLRKTVRLLAAYTLAAGILYLMVSGADMLASATLFSRDALAIALRSSLGTSLTVAMLGLLLVLTGSATRRSLWIVGIALVIGSRMLTGHPASREPSWLLMPMMFLHVTAAAFWYGSLYPLLKSLRQLPLPQVARLLHEFSARAMVLVGLLALVGILTALTHMSSPAALNTTWYGQLLIMKTFWFTVLMALAAWHKFSLSPRVEAGDTVALGRLRKSIVAETVVMTLVVFISVNVASTAPEAPTRAEQQASVIAPTILKATSLSGNYAVEVKLLERIGSTLQMSTKFSSIDGTSLMPLEVNATINIANTEVSGLPAQVTRLQGGYEIRSENAVAGKTTVTIDALVSDFDKERFRVELTP